MVGLFHEMYHRRRACDRVAPCGCEIETCWCQDLTEHDMVLANHPQREHGCHDRLNSHLEICNKQNIQREAARKKAKLKVGLLGNSRQ